MKYGKCSPARFANFVYICITHGKACTTFGIPVRRTNVHKLSPADSFSISEQNVLNETLHN